MQVNYRLIQHFTVKFPSWARADLYQEGCLACLLGKDPYYGMVDAFRKATHFKRKGEQYSYTEIDFLKVEPDVIEQIYLKEAALIFQRKILRLKPKWQTLIYLRYWQGLFLGEIAERFGNTESAVSRMHTKILKQLRKGIEHA